MGANKINYLIGDATSPKGDGIKIITHICNDIGAWGKGFVLALSNKWSSPEEEYKKWYANKSKFALGEVQFVKVEEDIIVANMIAQRDTLPSKSGPPIRYNALKEGLKKVKNKSIELGASVHMPRIGCGLAGGTWDKIEPIITEQLIENNIEVYVYDFRNDV